MSEEGQKGPVQVSYIPQVEAGNLCYGEVHYSVNVCRLKGRYMPSKCFGDVVFARQGFEETQQPHSRPNCIWVWALDHR